jgi:hypothetical protein
VTCPTCSETMHRVGELDSAVWFWCPRCGTSKCEWPIRDGTSGGDKDVPALVKRCRTFGAMLKPDSQERKLWLSAGIDEAVNLPEFRLGKET